MRSCARPWPCPDSSRLIYCSISGFGQHGPLSDLPAHDLNLQAVSGLTHLLRTKDGTPKLTDDAIGPACAEEGWNLELALVRVPGTPAPEGSSLIAVCQLSQNVAVD